MPLLRATKSVASPGGKHGVARHETRDPIGHAVAALSSLAQSSMLDRFRLRQASERAVYEATRGGFLAVGKASRTFQRSGRRDAKGTRVKPAGSTSRFDLTPSEDEQMLVDVVKEYAAEVLRPAAAEANETCAAPAEALAASREIGIPLLGIPEERGGIFAERSAMSGSLVHEALAHGDMGLAVAALAPGAVATAVGLWGTDEQQSTYLPAFTGEDLPAAALALTEPRPLFDPLQPATSARADGDGFVLSGVKSAVPRGAEAELFVIGAELDGEPRLFLVESSTAGLRVEADPSMGLRAAGLTKLHLEEVRVGADALLGCSADYRECVRLSRVAWCSLAVGTAQAMLDYVTTYAGERVAFGEPISHRQAVAFMIANIAIETQAMRLLTYKAASRAARGKDFAREAALARRLCTDKGMQIGLDGVQVLGGHGFVKEHPVERWYRDLRAIGLVEGGVLV